MFSKETYINRRASLLHKMSSYANEGSRGIAIFIGNVEAPAQFKENCYKFRQDSTWLYFFGIDDPAYAAIIDLDNSQTCIYANDFEIGDIIWMGPQESVASKAEKVGVSMTARAEDFVTAVEKAKAQGRPIHYIPATRYYNVLKLRDMGLNEKESSLALSRAIISMRLVKEACELEAIDDAAELGYEMHSVARNAVYPGVHEQYIVGLMEGVTLSKGWGVSFPTILSQHGETLHNHCHDAIIEPGKLLVIDAGAENNMHYASDFTRTLPTGGKFTAKQRDVYDIVHACNEHAFSLAKPGITYRDVHISVSRLALEGLKSLSIVQGDVDAMVAEGVAGLFQPHGLGHNMGLDVHDMEDYNETLVGYDDDQTRAKQLGLGNLRMARKLKPGYVITDEPGIYFIPALIAKWKKEGTDKGFVNYSKLEEYLDFGGIRLEDDLIITENGVRRVGSRRLPIKAEEVEEAMLAFKK